MFEMLSWGQISSPRVWTSLGAFKKKFIAFFIQIFVNCKFYFQSGSVSGVSKVLDPDLQNNIKKGFADPDLLDPYVFGPPEKRKTLIYTVLWLLYEF